MAEPEWEEGGEYIYLHSQSPAIARAVHHRISGSHISALFSHDDSPEARRWMVRVGTSYIDVQGVKDRTSALGDQAQGVLVDVSESEMLDLLREERAGDAQNWELARQRVDRIPGLVAVVR